MDVKFVNLSQLYFERKTVVTPSLSRLTDYNAVPTEEKLQTILNVFVDGHVPKAWSQLFHKPQILYHAALSDVLSAFSIEIRYLLQNIKHFPYLGRRLLSKAP